MMRGEKTAPAICLLTTNTCAMCMDTHVTCARIHTCHVHGHTHDMFMDTRVTCARIHTCDMCVYTCMTCMDTHVTCAYMHIYVCMYIYKQIKNNNKIICKLRVVMQDCDPSTWEEGAKRPGAYGQPGLHEILPQENENNEKITSKTRDQISFSDPL